MIGYPKVGLAQIWAAFVLLLFGLNLDQFIPTLSDAVVPKHVMVGALLCSLPFVRWHWVRTELFSNPVLWWLFAYCGISLLFLMLAPDTSLGAMRMGTIGSTVVFLLISLLAQPHLDTELQFTRVVLVITFLLGGASIVIDFLKPDLFLGAGLNIIGRAAGTYLNPNIGGMAIAFLALAIFRFCSPRFNFVIAGLALIAVALTFSRSSILVLVLGIVLTTFQGRLPRAWVLASTVVFIAFASSIAIYFSLLIDQSWANSLSRLAWMFGSGDISDSAAATRMDMVTVSLEQIRISPLLGIGLGGTLVWLDGTHNLILQHMVEYGLTGMLILPIFLLCYFLWSKRFIGVPAALTVCMCYAAFSQFSHNILEQGCLLIPLIATTTRTQNSGVQGRTKPFAAQPHKRQIG